MEYVLLVIVIGATLSPIAFALYDDKDKKLLFIGSIYGVNIIIWVLIYFMYVPVWLFLVYIVPTLKEFGYAENILYVIGLAELYQEWWFILFFISLFIVSFRINKRYEKLF